VDIDYGCKENGDGAFEYCSSLMDANIPVSVREIADSAFNHCGECFTIHTPESSYAESYAIANKTPYDNSFFS